MEDETKRLKQTIAILEKKLHEKNVALDAMYWVWCDGGCDGGVKRYTPNELTEEMVAKAERNTARLKHWFVNAEFKEEWRSWTQEQRVEWMSKRTKPRSIWQRLRHLCWQKMGV